MTIFSKQALEGKHVLITGATGGIGYETAKVVAAMGARVTITGRNVDTLQQLMTELHTVTDEKHVFIKVADITNERERIELIKESQSQLGTISGLVNAAGVAGGATLENLDETFITDMMNLNFTSTVMLTKEIYKGMVEQKEGAIVNVSSLSGLRGTYGNISYAASKFALIGFTQSLAVEAIQSNIRVNAVCPGFVDTKMAREAIMKKAERNGLSYGEQLKEIVKGLPSGRISTPIEVANTIAYLLTEAATNIVGESLKISGGSVM